MELPYKEIDLPSGAKARIVLAPFAVSKNLYQALLTELKSLHLDPKADVDVNLFKDLFCTGFSSNKIEKCLMECMKMVTYNGTSEQGHFLKVDNDSFESAKTREDYFTLCFEVMKENIAPFTKSLYAQFVQVQGLILKPNPA